VELSVRDAALLNRFQEIVPYYSSIRTRTRSTNFANRHTSTVWTVCALQFRRELIDAGLPVGTKSDVVAPPSTPVSETDYLRGLVDGDGSVGVTRLGLPFVSFTTSSEALKDFFLSQCRDLPGQPRHVSRNARDGVFNAMATRECAVELASRLYYENCLALQRKASGAKAAVSWSREPYGQLKLPLSCGRRGARHAREDLDARITQRALQLRTRSLRSPCS
jgi:hypothetical protein